MDSNPKMVNNKTYKNRTTSNHIVIYSRFNEYFISTLGKFVGHKFVLTNPAFYTPIEENDYVIVIGDLMKD